MDSDIRVIEAEPFYSVELAREPLKFGASVVEDCLYCHVRVLVENRRGHRAVGWGAIFLMDMWSWPDPAVPHLARQEAMRRLTDEACRLVADHAAYAHPVDLFMELEPELRRLSVGACEALHLSTMPFLSALVSAAAVDAAIHDAFGMVNGISTYDGYGPDHMAYDLSRYLGPTFRGRYIAEHIRPAFLPRIPVFHLVGGLDRLRRSEVPIDAPQDGLPNCLEDWIARDGLTCLKVKLRGRDLAWDVERFLEVVRIAREVQGRQGRAELHLSADTNEQCETPEYMIDWLGHVRERDAQAFADLLYIEQPTERDLTAHRFDMRRLSQIKPVILDESLTDLHDLELALSLGWSGIALKTCKCQSADLLFLARAEASGVPYTIQDLTNPGLALLQSVGLAARTHTLMGVEGNSRQYYPRTNKPEASVHPGVFTLYGGQAETSSLSGPGLGLRTSEIPRRIFHERAV